MCILTTTGVVSALGVSAAIAKTIAIVGNVALAVGAIGSTAMGVTSSVQQGKSTQAQMNYQAKVARNNAKIAQANADQKRQEGIEESRLQRMKTIQKVGAQQTAMAANGVDISSGTALDIIEDTSAMGELDALTTRYNYETQALGYEQQANNFNNQANLDVFAGQNAYKSGMISAVGEGAKGLGNIASVATRWYSPNSIGSSTRTASSWRGNTGTLSGDGVKEFMGNIA